MLELYQRYKEHDDEDAAIEIAEYFYRQLAEWSRLGEPPDGFIEKFEQFFAAIPDARLSPRDLVDLGIVHCAEALQSHRSGKDAADMTRLFLDEARLPFFACMDPEGYQLVKQHEFLEIDFQIFDVLGGDFPHDSARQFLLESPWADIWIVVRYLDSLSDLASESDLISHLARARAAYHERLILMALVILSAREVLDEMDWPEDLKPGLAESGLAMLDCLNKDRLAVAWEENLVPGFSREQLFFLLTWFELMQAPPGPGWVRLFERCVADTWTMMAPESGEVSSYQPLAEFTGSILSLLLEDEVSEIGATSLVIPEFFAHLEDYNEEAFHSLLLALAPARDDLLRELEINLPERLVPQQRYKTRFVRLNGVASMLGYRIRVFGGRPLLKKKDGVGR